MDDIRLSAGLPSHPKVRKLLRALGPAAGWSWVVLLIWTGTNRSNGDLGGLDVDDLEIAADWTGEAGAFIRTLRELRMLDGQDLHHRIHDWAEHNPYAAGREARRVKAKFAADARWNPARSRTLAAAEQAMHPASGGHASSIIPHQSRFSGHATSIIEQCPLPEQSKATAKAKSKSLLPKHTHSDNPRATSTQANGKSARVSMAYGQAKQSLAPADLSDAIAKALNEQGISCTGGHPELRAFAEQGATVAEFSDAAAEAVRRGKPMLGYVLGIVRGRRRDGMTPAPAYNRNGPSPEVPPEPAEVANAKMREHLERLTGPS